MKIIFTTSGNDLSAPLDSRFGRALKFLVYDKDLETFEVIDNHPNMNAAQGAGIQAAQQVAQAGAQILITGHCGPKAFRVLQAAGIQVYNSDAPTVADALKAYLAGNIKPMKTADVEGHWA